MNRVAMTTQAALQKRGHEAGIPPEGPRGGGGIGGVTTLLPVMFPAPPTRTPQHLPASTSSPQHQLPHSQEDEDAPAHGAQHGEEGLPAAARGAGGQVWAGGEGRLCTWPPLPYAATFCHMLPNTDHHGCWERGAEHEAPTATNCREHTTQLPHSPNHKAHEEIGNHRSAHACGRAGAQTGNAAQVETGGQGGRTDRACHTGGASARTRAAGSAERSSSHTLADKQSTSANASRQTKTKTMGSPAARVSKVWISEGTSQPRGPAGQGRQAGKQMAEGQHESSDSSDSAVHRKSFCSSAP